MKFLAYGHPASVFPTVLSTDPCICGSKRSAEQCCLQNNQFYKRPVVNAIDFEKNGYSHPQCYLRQFFDCSRDISFEHYLSESILQLFSSASEPAFPVAISRRHPLNPKRQTTRSYGSRILCRKHNNMLHRLDDEAYRFFRTIALYQGIKRFDVLEQPIDTSFRIDDISMEGSLFNGHDIESWMTKVFIGYLVSDHMPNTSFSSLPTELREKIPQQLALPMLDRQQSGLWVSVLPTTGGVLNASLMELVPLYGGFEDAPEKEEDLVGIKFRFSNVILYYIFAEVGDFTGLGECIYRPISCKISSTKESRQIIFSWFVKV